MDAEARKTMERDLKTKPKADVVELKSLANPPAIVKLVMEAVMILLGEEPVRYMNASGEMQEDFWAGAKKMFGDPSFLKKIENYDKDHIPPDAMKTVREKYISNPEFDPPKVRKVSRAAESFCRWVMALELYDRVEAKKT